MWTGFKSNDGMQGESTQSIFLFITKSSGGSIYNNYVVKVKWCLHGRDAKRTPAFELRFHKFEYRLDE